MARVHSTTRYQSPVKGGRNRLYARVVYKIKKEIESTAARFNCSTSFVQNTILAEALGIDIDEVYYRDLKSANKRKRA